MVERELEKSKSSKVGKSYGPIYPCAEKYKYLMQFQNSDELSAQQPKPVSSSNIETIDTPLFWWEDLRTIRANLLLDIYRE